MQQKKGKNRKDKKITKKKSERQKKTWSGNYNI